ncbi:MAG TPA: GGDEF domain-containing protein, partial [Longimicrobiales bacterium]
DGPRTGSTFGGTESESALAARAAATLVRQPGSLGKLPVVVGGERFERKPKSMVAVPLKVANDVVAVITAWAHGEISRHVVQDLETLAPYAALQLRHAREFGVMRTRAERDALTGLANRRAFEEHFGGEAGRYERYQRPFSMVMLDIDHFKSVNDRYGHEAGDHILQQVAKVVASSLRNVDFAARLGGEEFVVLLPETDITKGIEIAERIRHRVEELNPSWRGQVIPVRISAGVSAVPGCVRFPNELVRSADAALYASKHAGRNRVTAARPA